MSTPTTMIADSINSCSQSLKFLKDLERQLAQANAKADADLRDARTERDKAIKQSRVSQAELDAEKQVAARYKSSLLQVEGNIEQQRRIISRLDREVNHWKEQARNWQEHFTRVEEERCSLATRLDEMIAQQSQTYGSLISAHLFPQIEASLSAPVLKKTLTAGSLPNSRKRIVTKPKTQPSSADTAPEPRKPKVSVSRTKINSEQANKLSDSSTWPPSGRKDEPTLDAPPPLLVRRVQAVIHVKSEEEDNVNMQSDANSTDDDNYVPRQTRRPRQSIGNRKSKQMTQAKDDGLQSSGGVPSSDKRRNKALDSDGEDELILGAENSRQNNIVVSANAAPPAKKRKLNASTRQKPSKKD